MEPRDPTIGQRIVETRERKGWKQKELATRASIPVPTLNRIERGQQSLFAERVVTLARVLGVSTDYLLGRQDTPTPPTPRKQPRPHKTTPVG
jgi:transcriptional regulator with XRE-family HTH domain